MANSSKGSVAGGAQLSASDNSVTIWSAPGTEKVLQNKTTGYDAIKGDAEINVYSAKGEYEGTQLILTSSTSAVTGINLEPSDLALSTDANVKFDKNLVEVFFERYLELTRIYDGNNAEEGNYPDALPPMESVVNLGQNKMEANSNQGLYVRFNVPLNQQAGTYTGVFKLSYNGTQTDVPVTLTVENLEVSEETHSRSMFLHDWYIGLGELDTTQAMFDKYIEAGFDYRISPGNIVYNKTFDDAGMEYYADKAVEYMKNPKCTQVSIPFQMTLVNDVPFVDEQGRAIVVYKQSGEAYNEAMYPGSKLAKGDPVTISGTGVDTEKFELFLDKLVERVAEDWDTTGKDYIRKLGSHIVDEPAYNESFTGGESFVRTQVTMQTFKSTIWRVTKKYAALADEQLTQESKEMYATIAQQINDIVVVVSNPYQEKYAPHVDNWCPTVDNYNSDVQREKYADQPQKWWYTCVVPYPPYPSYHIEDTLISARALSWMQAQYDVVGNLYWATTVYALYDGGSYQFIEDYYTGNGSRFPNVNGDGYLFYPGKLYGVNGPIGSLRLEAIRDGLEEYEVLYALKDKYAQLSELTGVNIDASKVVESLTTDIYSGTTVNTTSEKFANARAMLYSVAKLVNSDARFAIVDFNDNGFGKISYKLFAADGFSILDGENQVEGEQVNGGKIYTVTKDLAANETTLSLKITNGTETYTFEKRLGGEVNFYDASQLENSFEASDTTEIVSSVEENELKVEFGETTSIFYQTAYFTHDLLADIDQTVSKIIVHVNVKEGDPAIGSTLSISADQPLRYQGSGNVKVVEIASKVLTVGDNTIELSLNTVNFEQYGAIETLYFRFDSSKDDDTIIRTIYLKDIIIYNK